MTILDRVPYITDGSIYQRVGEVSDPVPLSDRYLLEKLMDRKKEFSLKIDQFCQNKFVTSLDFTQPFLEFYVYLDNDSFFDDFYTSEFMDNLKKNFNTEISILSEGVNVKSSIGFSNMYASLNSYILRNNDSYNINDIGCAMELFINGNFKFVLPFNLIEKENIDLHYRQYYDDNLKICDLPLSMLIFDTVVSQYKRLLSEHNFNSIIYVRFNLKNCFQLTFCFEDKSFRDYILENGVPISFKFDFYVNYVSVKNLTDNFIFSCFDDISFNPF